MKLVVWLHSLRRPAVLAAVVCAVSPVATQTSAAQQYRDAAPIAWVALTSGATAVGRETCEGCHANASTTFPHTTHAFVGTDCEACHGLGSLHVDDTEQHGHIHRLSNEAPEAANWPCLQCHKNQEALHEWRGGRHERNGVRCVDCHATHSADASSARKPGSETCTRCHAAEAAQGEMPYHHPVREGRMECADCHNPHGGRAGALKASNANDLCLSCHGEYRGPFTYQHPPVSESCLKCHQPHGSMHQHMLAVSEPALCLQCHSGHHDGSGVPLLNACTNCHGSIHGTDTPSATGGSVFIDK
jgi:DmsE family decaheme c-type cytochrome